MLVQHVLFFYVLCWKEMPEWLSLTKLSDMPKTFVWKQLFKTCMHVCESVFVSECVDQWSSSLSGWALCFDFFSSSLRSNASPLSYAARTSLEGLQSLSPSTDETPPPFTLPQLPLPSPPLLLLLLLATCTDLLVLSFVPHSSSCLNL